MKGAAVVANLPLPFARPCICIASNPRENPVDDRVRMGFHTQCAMHSMLHAMVDAMLQSRHVHGVHDLLDIRSFKSSL